MDYVDKSPTYVEKEPSLDDEITEPSTGSESTKHHRCSLCNSVRSPFIATNPEEYKPKLMMHQDPRDPTAIICHECYTSIEETNYEYDLDYEYDPEVELEDVSFTEDHDDSF